MQESRRQKLNSSWKSVSAGQMFKWVRYIGIWYRIPLEPRQWLCPIGGFLWYSSRAVKWGLWVQLVYTQSQQNTTICEGCEQFMGCPTSPAKRCPMGPLPDAKNCGLRMRREFQESFPRHWLQRKPIVSDPGLHHGTWVTHVPWRMSVSINRGGEENVPSIPGANATPNFTYLARGLFTVDTGDIDYDLNQRTNIAAAWMNYYVLPLWVICVACIWYFVHVCYHKPCLWMTLSWILTLAKFEKPDRNALCFA